MTLRIIISFRITSVSRGRINFAYCFVYSLEDGRICWIRIWEVLGTRMIS